MNCILYLLHYVQFNSILNIHIIVYIIYIHISSQKYFKVKRLSNCIKYHKIVFDDVQYLDITTIV